MQRETDRHRYIEKLSNYRKTLKFTRTLMSIKREFDKRINDTKLKCRDID